MTPTYPAMPILAKQIQSVRRSWRPSTFAVPLVVASLALVFSSACRDYLTGIGKDQDPNHVNALSDPGPLYLSVQTAQAVQFEGGLGRIGAMYVQQIAGAARQQQAVDLYQSQPTDIDSYYSSAYAAGGLVDVRAIQTLAEARDDSTMSGIAKVYEALIIGTTTSFWGDIPYRQANQPNTTPALDPQQQVYADVQAKLDTAITFLSKTGRTNTGPTQFEIVYTGAGAPTLRTLYTQVAYTLKARYYMHLAERDPTNYARAQAAALNGISTPANDMNWFNAGNATSQNIFYQFQGQRGDLGPAAAMIDLMGSRITAGVDTPDRLKFYFLDYCRSIGSTGIDQNNPANYAGYRPAGDPNLPGGAGAPATAKCGDGSSAAGAYSDFNFINAQGNGTQTIPGFRSPAVTFAENQLILAEASYQIAGGGAAGIAAAQPYLNAVRARQVYGADQNGPITFPAQTIIPATLQNIMEEKYIDLFLIPESWSDFKRTCLPFLAPAPTNPGAATPGTQFVRRLPYGLNEISTNPNVAAAAAGFSPFTPTFDDPNPCPALNYTTTTPRAY